MQILTAATSIKPAFALIIRRIFPPALVACGLALTAAWVLYLGYGIFRLLDLVV